MTVDHASCIALVTRHCRGRSDARAARALYDDTIRLDEDATCVRAHVVNAARAVYALRAANAISDYRAEKALGRLLVAYMEVRDLP